MSQHQAFRRAAVPQEVAQKYQTKTIAAPIRGLVESENFAFMQPGGAMVLDNWAGTMRGLRIRGGSIVHCTLADTTTVISMVEYNSSSNHKLFAGTATRFYDVTADTAISIKTGQTSGNYTGAQMANMAGDYLLVTNEIGNSILRYDGTSWETLTVGYVPAGGKPSMISGPPGTTVVAGQNLVYVWKYRNRLFFIEGGSMNAYYLPIDAAGGALLQIPLSGAASEGGKLIFGATWSVNVGDGLDDKCCFVTDLGEVLIFTGSNPGDAANWRQEGRYKIGKPMGINSHVTLGGDLLIATIDGITPMSAAVQKDAQDLELAMPTRLIRSLWRREALDKGGKPWTMCRWDEYGALFVTWPGTKASDKYCALVNTGTLAWSRFTNWDAQCFGRLMGNMYFGTRNGVIMQADRTGKDINTPYTATMIGGWELFDAPSNQTIWHQARAHFTSRPGQPFNPKITSCINYVVKIPPPPPSAPDPGVLDLWDQGDWDEAKWDQASGGATAMKDTGWISIGETGYAHAPVVQVTIAQEAKPEIEIIALAVIFEPMGVTV